MLKLIKFGIIIFYCLQSTAQNTLNVSADIRGRSCAGGLGLCGIKSITEDNSSIVSAKRVASDAVLLIIEKQKLSIENQISLVGKEFSKINGNEKLNFIQEVDIVFEQETLIKLGINPKYSVLKSGLYDIEISEKDVLITIKLLEK